MLEQYMIQYDLDACCLRAPWIMEKDDFKYQLSFGDDVFGGPRWRDLVGAEAADRYVRRGRGPGDARSRRPPGEAQLRPRRGSDRRDPARHRQPRRPPPDVQRLHGRAGRLRRARRLPRRRRAASTAVPIRTPYRSTWLDNAKAKFLLGWRPRYDLEKMIEAAWGYQRAPDDPRKVWYPGLMSIPEGSILPPGMSPAAAMRRCRRRSRRAAARVFAERVRLRPALAGRGARAGQPDRRAHRLQRRLRAAARDRSARRHRRRARAAPGAGAAARLQRGAGDVGRHPARRLGEPG